MQSSIFLALTQGSSPYSCLEPHTYLARPAVGISQYHRHVRAVSRYGYAPPSRMKATIHYSVAAYTVLISWASAVLASSLSQSKAAVLSGRRPWRWNERSLDDGNSAPRKDLSSSSMYESEINALLQIRSALTEFEGDGQPWGNEWTSSDPCGTSGFHEKPWQGVSCREDFSGSLKKFTVVALNFSWIGSELGPSPRTVSFPAAVAQLTNLTILDFTRSLPFTGSIPSAYGFLSKLQMLYLSFSGVTEIPAELGYLSSLQVLDLGYNQIKALPDSFSNLGNLTYLNLHSCGIGGQFPACVQGMQNLTYLDMYGNGFTGVVPTWMASLTRLQFLDISLNQLSGPIPTFLERIPIFRFIGNQFCSVSSCSTTGTSTSIVAVMAVLFGALFLAVLVGLLVRCFCCSREVFEENIPPANREDTGSDEQTGPAVDEEKGKDFFLILFEDKVICVGQVYNLDHVEIVDEAKGHSDETIVDLPASANIAA